jgi:hypothetical protein
MDERISRIARGLSRSLLAYGGIHVSVRDLPDAVYRALKKIGYGRRDIEVIYDTKYSVSAAFEINRALAYTIDLRTGRITDSQIGSWGGSNPWEDRSIDRGEAHPVPSGSVVIAGESGGRGNFLRLYIRPEDVGELMPSPDDDIVLTQDEKMALDVIGGIKSGYRSDSFRRKGLGEYSVENPIVESLMEKGLVKSIGGGIRITTQGKNLR